MKAAPDGRPSGSSSSDLNGQRSWPLSDAASPPNCDHWQSLVAPEAPATVVWISYHTMAPWAGRLQNGCYVLRLASQSRFVIFVLAGVLPRPRSEHSDSFLAFQCQCCVNLRTAESQRQVLSCAREKAAFVPQEVKG